ncbi:uncharacterized protein [Haliaeetus albicilla]|uniref:uncharacterized protein isoform X2 n=1 Tax=Haliaeetus albicilla TaxID=8969 RepID=UPI0037E7AEC6
MEGRGRGRAGGGRRGDGDEGGVRGSPGGRRRGRWVPLAAAGVRGKREGGGRESAGRGEREAGGGSTGTNGSSPQQRRAEANAPRPPLSLTGGGHRPAPPLRRCRRAVTEAPLGAAVRGRGWRAGGRRRYWRARWGGRGGGPRRAAWAGPGQSEKLAAAAAGGARSGGSAGGPRRPPPRHPPGAGEPLTNAHCALGDSTVRVTAANLLLGHRCVATSPRLRGPAPRRHDACIPFPPPRNSPAFGTVQPDD